MKQTGTRTRTTAPASVKPQQKAEQVDNRVKEPDEWTTGDEPMTGAQRSYLKTLSDEAQESMKEELTKAQASKRIDALQQKTGRGASRGKQTQRAANTPKRSARKG